MKTNYLFPHKFKWISGVLFVLSLLVLVLYFMFAEDEDSPLYLPVKVFAFVDSGFLTKSVFFGWTTNSITDEILMLVVLVSGIIYAFSKEKHEDEMVLAIRLHCLAWSTIANYSIILLCYSFIFGFGFLNILMVAMFSQLLIFIILFRYKMYRFNNTRQDEE